MGINPSWRFLWSQSSRIKALPSWISHGLPAILTVYSGPPFLSPRLSSLHSHLFHSRNSTVDSLPSPASTRVAYTCVFQNARVDFAPSKEPVLLCPFWKRPGHVFRQWDSGFNSATVRYRSFPGSASFPFLPLISSYGERVAVCVERGRYRVVVPCRSENVCLHDDDVSLRKRSNRSG